MIRLTLRLLLAYLVASFLMTALAVALQPGHAHVPAVAVMLGFPLIPLLMFKAMLAGDIRWQDVWLLGCFAVVFGGTAWLASRRKAKAD